MKTLNTDFTLDKYGLSVRLVKEEDAEFIVKLRTNENLNKYINSTSTDINQQIEWIRSYKKREKAGNDYYFIYHYHNEPVGVNRIYEINNNNFIHGSWIFTPNTKPYCSLAAAVIAREIAFDILELDIEIDTAGIHKDNTGVLQFAKFMGEEFTGSYYSEKGEFLTGILTKESFNKNKNKILKLFPKKIL